MTTTQQITGVAAGVPYVAVPPSTGPAADAPTVIAWHLLDAPRTESAFAAALPLDGLDAWRIYLGLPMCGSRLPAGGVDELMRLGFQDAVMNLHGPICDQAVAEFPAALAELRRHVALGSGPVGLVGGSLGAAVAARVLAEGGLDARATVLISPLLDLHAVVEALSAQFGVTYPWSPPAREVAARMDVAARAGRIAGQGEPAVLMILGEDDDERGFRDPAVRVRDALAGCYADPGRVGLQTVPAMGHALAEEPGVEPAPQTPHAAVVDALAVDWLGRFL